MAPLTIPSLSREFVKVRVFATEAGAVVDPTSDTVEFAFKDSTAEPEEADWTAGSWESSSGKYWARILVGPDGDVTLTDGEYHTWIRITGATEAVVRNVGLLKVT